MAEGLLCEKEWLRDEYHVRRSAREQIKVEMRKGRGREWMTHFVTLFEPGRGDVENAERDVECRRCGIEEGGLILPTLVGHWKRGRGRRGRR